MKKVKKGTAGYIRYEQMRCFLVTFVLFALPIGLYIIGYVVTNTKANWLTFVAILGCLPACKSMVSLIMIMLQRPVKPEVLTQAQQANEGLTASYELVFTTYEHTSPVDTVAVCGNQVICYTPDTKTNPQELEKHITKILTTNGFQSMQVKVFQDMKQYCQRAVHLRNHQEKYRDGISFTPDTRYPELSREELIMHTLYAISL
jgi:hypothetical protein